jgi:hypothetical protein
MLIWLMCRDFGAEVVHLGGQCRNREYAKTKCADRDRFRPSVILSADFTDFRRLI